MMVELGTSKTKDEYWSLVYHQGKSAFQRDRIYDTFFREVVPALDQNKKLRVLFGNHDGSLSRGLSNKTSDIDMHIFCNTPDRDATYELLWAKAEIDGIPTAYDLAPHCWDVTREAIAAYDGVTRRYPSVFYRSREEQEKYSPENIHWNVRYRDDGEMFEFTQFLIADEVFICEREREQLTLPRLCRMVRTIDLMDLQYVRAYGNYHQLMEGQEPVLVRKYLYTLYELFLCYWIVRYGTKPSTVFQNLLAGQELSDRVRESVDRVLELNAEGKEHKTRLKCEADATLNAYIRDSLAELKEKLASYPAQERFDALMERTEPKRRHRVIYF